jgi:hypothetical protein
MPSTYEETDQSGNGAEIQSMPRRRIDASIRGRMLGGHGTSRFSLEHRLGATLGSKPFNSFTCAIQHVLMVRP